MSDDSFIREVDEQLREDRLKEFWSRFGNYVIALAVLIVIATAAWRGWQYYTENRSAGFGDRYMNAMNLAEEGQSAEVERILGELSAEGSGEYPGLARMRLAAELERTGDKSGAITAFDAIVADTGMDAVLRDVARLRAGILAVDTHDFASVKARLEPLAAAGAPFRSVARQALAIAAMKAGENQVAHDLFKSIADDAEAASGARTLANSMLGILAGKGVGQDG